MKKTRIIIPLVIVALIATLCILRWQAWFGKIEEPPYNTPDTIDRLVINMGATGFNSRTITWRCGDSLQPAELHLKLENTKDITTIPAEGTIVTTDGGSNAYYKVDITPSQGYYMYQVVTGEHTSPWYHLHVVEQANHCAFLVSGDIQDIERSVTDTIFQALYKRYPQTDFLLLLGDVIHRPIDNSWNLWFNEIDTIAACLPHIANCGNHEYYKGRKGDIDPRWCHTFTHPNNGPDNVKAQSYYLDLPSMRLIVIDTQGLKRLRDYRRTKQWLKELVDNNTQSFCVVALHHPLQSQSIGRYGIWERLYFKKTLEKVDLVLQGHDHSYARTCTKQHNEKNTPINIVTTNSEKHYLSKCRRKADRIACGERLYEYIEVNENQMTIYTYLTDKYTLYDKIHIEKDENGNNTVTTEDALSDEQLLMPKKYEGKRNYKTIRYNRCRELRREALQIRAEQ
ncbi:MAG: metallophosphoesterase [Bacteroidales bacterium]|nr:metallophosphoesterase [Bacteroidales bacterium]